MNRAEELVADALALLHAHGHAPRISESGGKHIKIRWLDAGRRYTLVISRTPSDLRARLNSRSTLKRLLRRGAHEHENSFAKHSNTNPSRDEAVP
jgi:hypothetical protein